IAADPKITVATLTNEINKFASPDPAALKVIEKLYSVTDSAVCKNVQDSTKTLIQSGVGRVYDAISGPEGILKAFIADVTKDIDDLEAEITAATDVAAIKKAVGQDYDRIVAAFESIDAQKQAILKTFTTPLD